MAKDLGVPLKLIKEFLNQSVKVETSSGDFYKGTLLEIEDNMNITLNGIKAKLMNGRSVKMASVYIKGSRIKMVILPKSAVDSIPALTRRSFRGGRGGRGMRGGVKSSYDRRPF